MKVEGLVRVVRRVAQVQARLGASETQNALTELAEILSTSGQQDVDKLVQKIRSGESERRKSRRHTARKRK